MTKLQAIDRVNKLRALAKSTTNPHEKDTAEKRAKVIMKEHGIVEGDLLSSGKAAAFDRLVDLVGDYATKHPEVQKTAFGSMQLIGDFLAQSKKGLSPKQKAELLDKVSGGLGFAGLLWRNKTVDDIKAIVDSVIKSYNV